MIFINKEAIQKEVVELYFQKWEKLSQQIHEAHNLRNGEAENLMRNGITLFEELVLSSSLVDQSSMFDTNEQYEVLPINGMERYLFVRMKPGQYACYRQLDELFKEIKKRFARLRVKAK